MPVSRVIRRPEPEPEHQLTLSFEPGVSERYKSLRECIAAGVYRNGLGNTAIDLNIAPGNLSVQISDDPTRHFSVDSLEKYIEKSRDTTPIYYLIDRFLGDKSKDSEAEMAAAVQALKQMAPAFKKLGLI
jgi:hypothetical protein